MPEVLAPLIPLVVALVCLAIAYMLTVLVIALFKPIVDILSQIPVVGGKLAGLIVKVEQAVSNAIGHAFGAVESLTGAAFHEMARMSDWLWREFEAHSVLIAAISSPLAQLMLAFHAVKSLVHSIEHDLRHGSKRVEEELKRFARGIDRIDSKIRGLDHRIEDVVLPRVRTAEREIAHLGDVVIPDIRGLVNGAETDISALRKWITANFPLVGSTAFVGAIAAALSALGLSWLRCESNPFNNNRNACGLWGDLSALLGLAFIAAEVASLEELIGVAQTVTEGITQGVEDLLKV